MAQRGLHWWPALLVSLLLHAVLTLLLAAVPAPGAGGRLPSLRDKVPHGFTDEGFYLQAVVTGAKLEPAPSPWNGGPAVPSTPPAEPFQAALVSIGSPGPGDEPQELTRPPGSGRTAGGGNFGGTQAVGPPGPVGRPGGGVTSFFQVPVCAKKLVYVLDRSSSMSHGGALHRAGRELLASLQSLPPDASFQVIVYNSTAHPLLRDRPGWLPADGDHFRRVADALAVLQAEGGTAHRLALPLALSLAPEVVFFLTDGSDLSADYLRRVTDQNRHGAVIHVIEVDTGGPDRPATLLMDFARANGGTYHWVSLAPGIQ